MEQKGKSKWIKIGICLAVVVVLVVVIVMVVRSRAASAAFRNQVPTETVTLNKTSIVNSISVSGVVKSDMVQNIYSTQTYPVQEIFVEVGDSVKTGDVLAVLDTSRLMNDIEQAEVNYENALLSADEEVRSNNNSIINAESSLDSAIVSLEKQKISTANAERDLKEARDKALEGFDSYSYDVAIEDAKVTLERKMTDLAKAEKDLEEALNDFDDYTYQNNINNAKITLDRKKSDLADVENEITKDFDDHTYQKSIADAKITLDRKKSELKDAENNLPDKKTGISKDFDDYTYKNAINDAEKDYMRKMDDYAKARTKYDEAVDDYNYAKAADKATAQTAVDNAKSSMDTAGRAQEDADAKRQSAKKDLQKAIDDFNKTVQETYDKAKEAVDDAQRNYDNAVTDLEKAKENAGTDNSDKLTNAKNAVDDAQEAYDKTLSDLERAKKDAATAAYDKVTDAQNAVADAQRSYDKAVSDKTRAEDTELDKFKDEIASAQKAYDDSKKQLESAIISVESSQNSLNQSKDKLATQSSSVAIQRLNLEKLYTQLAESEIVANADGIITEVNVKVGATPSGTLFVIEDVDNLYVSANITEYNLSSVSIGQKGLVTTDATGDSVYEGEVSYISPKAVSEAGSTSVEFEVRTKLNEPDTKIKIGMNAYLNIVTASNTDVYVVPLSAVKTIENESFVYISENESRKQVPVTVGIKNSTSAEISGSGLSDGMQVITNPDGGASNSGSSFSGQRMMFGGGMN